MLLNILFVSLFFWMFVGIVRWILVFIEFRKVSFLRPGLLELIIAMILGPFCFL